MNLDPTVFDLVTPAVVRGVQRARGAVAATQGVRAAP